MKNKAIKTISALLALILAFSAVPVFAVNGGAASGVSDEMCSAKYWTELLGSGANKQLLSSAEVDVVNGLAQLASGTNVYDLKSIKDTANADSLRETLSKSAPPDRDLYINGKQIDKQAYFDKINKAILDTAYRGTAHPSLYAICTENADIKSIPTSDTIGYSASDCDDEYQSSCLYVGDPFIVRQQCIIDGKTYYYGLADHLTGWVEADKLGICENKDEWLKAWDFDTAGKDFLVVTQDKIVLERSILGAYSSERVLTLGTRLKLVSDEEMPLKVAERGTWNNYVVWLPVRAQDGSLELKPALISQHYSVSIGYLPFTQANVLKAAFACIGNRYGWGNMLGATDCSGFNRMVYRCFGICMPRNTNWQQLLPGRTISLDGVSDAEKQRCVESLPAGSLLYFSGHTMIYVGTKDGVPYVISNTGALSDSEGEVNVVDEYSIILTPLTVRRRNGSTWLQNLTAAVVLPDTGKLAKEGIKLATLFDDVPKESQSYKAVQWAKIKGITDGAGERLFKPDDYCTRAQMITFMWRAAGCPEPELTENPFTDVAESAYYAKAVLWAYEKRITSGTSATRFSPAKTVTVDQVDAFILRAFEPERADDEWKDSGALCGRAQIVSKLYERFGK